MPEYRFWLDKFDEGVTLASSFARPQFSGRLFFCGMGGSAISGAFVSAWCRRFGVDNVSELDPFDIPCSIGSQDFVVLVSCSGNTWEIVAALRELHGRGVPMMAVTRGGSLGDLAKDLKITVLFTPQRNLQPRQEMGLFVGILLVLVGDRFGLIDRFRKHLPRVVSSCLDLLGFDEFIELVLSKREFYVCGVSGDSVIAARRCQTQFNENSNVRAVFSAFPELMHNLVVGFTESSDNPVVLLLATKFLDSRLERGLGFLCKVLEEKGVCLYRPAVLGDTWEEQLLHLIVWSDFASHYLACERGVDAESVEIIDQMKQLSADG